MHQQLLSKQDMPIEKQRVFPKTDYVLATILLLALGLRLSVAWAPISWLLRYVICDDSFYYFTIARNIANGFGVTFDKLSPTNGFHPLWMLCITPIFMMVKNSYHAIHAILTLSAVIDTLSVYMLYWIMRKIEISRGISLLVSFIYTCFPRTLMSCAGTMNGLETAINVFMILVFLWLYLHIKQPISYTHSILLGLVAGLLFLARTDNAILLIIMWPAMLFFNRSWHSVYRLTIGGLTALLVAAPWLIWNYTTFDSLVQVSGLSMPFVNRQNLAWRGWTYFDYFVQFLKNIGETLSHLSGMLILTKVSLEFLFVVVIFFILFTSLALIFLKDKHRNKTVLAKQLSAWLPLVLVFPVFVLVQTMRAVQLRSWYYFSIVPFLLVLVAIALDHLSLFLSRQTIANWCDIGPESFKIFAIIIVTTGFAYSVNKRLTDNQIVGELEKYRVVKLMNNILPNGTRVGAWNAGIYGYFYEKGQIVNLDGLVNNQAYLHILNNSLCEYVRDNSIGYLVDDSKTFQAWAPFWNSSTKNIIDELQVIQSHRNTILGRLHHSP